MHCSQSTQISECAGCSFHLVYPHSDSGGQRIDSIRIKMPTPGVLVPSKNALPHKPPSLLVALLPEQGHHCFGNHSTPMQESGRSTFSVNLPYDWHECLFTRREPRNYFACFFFECSVMTSLTVLWGFALHSVTYSSMGTCT